METTKMEWGDDYDPEYNDDKIYCIVEKTNPK